MTAKPVRLQLSRRKGFDLQALSRKFNGRDCVKVTRPGRWGNPFIVNPHVAPGSKGGGDYICVPTIEEAVSTFRVMLVEHPDLLAEAWKHLRGKNLACWCKPGEPCHADVLLELVNLPAINDHPEFQAALRDAGQEAPVS